MNAKTPPQETLEGPSPRPTPNELEERAEALGKEIRNHLDRGESVALRPIFGPHAESPTARENEA
ncbi:hypothetical protein [Streptomyces milbemycinicus]|uniref:hypothetical protein n=1 Tax=Streptomyces milbemycinicus TaxID=476552 RepID=UPI0034049FAE